MTRDVIVSGGGSKHLRLRRLKRDLLHRSALAFLRRVEIEGAPERPDQAHKEAEGQNSGPTRQKPTLSAAKHETRLIP